MYKNHFWIHIFHQLLAAIFIWLLFLSYHLQHLMLYFSLAFLLTVAMLFILLQGSNSSAKCPLLMYHTCVFYTASLSYENELSFYNEKFLDLSFWTIRFSASSLISCILLLTDNDYYWQWVFFKDSFKKCWFDGFIKFYSIF